MVVRIVLWSLADSKTTIEELRRYLRDESVDAFAEVEACASRRGSPTRLASAGAPSTSSTRSRRPSSRCRGASAS